MRILLPLAALVLIAALAPAQTLTFVSPPAYANLEGPGGNNWPFYRSYQTFTYMQLHDDLPQRPMLISSLAFRRDQNSGGNYTTAAWSAVMTVRLSTAATTSGTASTTFAANHGGDLSEVLTSTKINFPASSGGPMPRPFLNKVAFAAKPFLFKNTPTVPKSLCWEFRIHSHTLVASSYHDVASSSVSYSRTYIGTGGVATGQTQPSYDYAYVTTGKGGLILYGRQYYCGINETPFMWVGYSDKRWGPFTLPFDLTPLGGKGNSIYTGMLVLVVGAGKTDTKGYYDWVPTTEGLPIPADPILLNQPMFMQHGSTDMGNKAFPFVLTRAVKLVLTAIPKPVEICRIYRSNDDKATTGSMSTTYGLITRFEYR